MSVRNNGLDRSVTSAYATRGMFIVDSVCDNSLKCNFLLLRTGKLTPKPLRPSIFTIGAAIMGNARMEPVSASRDGTESTAP